MSDQTVRNQYFDLKAAKIQNFGDQLARKLCDDVVTKFLIEQKVNPAEMQPFLFIIGSWLNHEFFREKCNGALSFIMGAGAGYSHFPVRRTIVNGYPIEVSSQLRASLKDSHENGEIKFLLTRGPLTCTLLGLNESPPRFVDGGYLVRRLSEAHKYIRAEKRHRIGLMPHYTAAVNSPSLKKACQRLGWTYIDPRDGVDHCMREIAGCELFLTEALHGAIVADALRVKWIPFRTSDDIYRLKWLDFFASIEKKYDPMSIPVKWRFQVEKTRNPIRLIRAVSHSIWGRFLSLWHSNDRTLKSLIELTSSPIMMSSDEQIARIDADMEWALQKLALEYSKLSTLESTVDLS